MFEIYNFPILLNEILKNDFDIRNAIHLLRKKKIKFLIIIHFLRDIID